MSRDTATRDVTLNALTVLTGGLTAAALVGTGLVTGLAADQTAQKAHAKAVAAAHVSELAAAAQLKAEIVRRSVPTPRPTRTVVTTSTVVATRYIHAKATVRRYSQVQVSSRRSGSSSYSSSSSSRSRTSWAPAPAPVRAQAPAAPAYVPPPAAPAPSAAS